MAERRGSIGQPRAGSPASDDIWQAATLLIGVYGRDAASYADSQRVVQEDLGDFDGAHTWTLIASEIDQLIRAAPRDQLH